MLLLILKTYLFAFFSDDPEQPKKQGYFRRNQVDQLWEPEQNDPIIHRFVLRKQNSKVKELECIFLVIVR